MKLSSPQVSTKKWDSETLNISLVINMGCCRSLDWVKGDKSLFYRPGSGLSTRRSCHGDQVMWLMIECSNVLSILKTGIGEQLNVDENLIEEVINQSSESGFYERLWAQHYPGN